MPALSPSGGSSFIRQDLSPIGYAGKVLSYAPIAYWIMGEASGTTALDATGNSRTGAYTAVTLGQTGIGDSRTSASFDGSTSYVNIYTASLAGAFNGQEGSMSIWGKVSGSGVWTDAAARRLIYLAVDANNRISFVKPTANNEIDWLYNAGGTSKAGGVVSFSPTAFFHLGLTWSKAADQVKFYVNGVQSGATVTGLGTFAGSLATTTTLIGAISQAPANVWSGTLAHAAVWTTPLSAAQMLALATTP